MKIKQYDLYMANLSPAKGTEAGKTRPVVIIQTDLLNDSHPSTIICPITTNVKMDIELLRVHLTTLETEIASDILVDQMRAIDNKRLLNKIGTLTKSQQQKLRQNIQIILDL